ncbi:MAG: EamA family transporter [Candidatus Hodarchaeales archaeon]
MTGETVLGIFFALLTALVWGTSALLYRIGLKTHDYLIGTLIRVIAAIPFLIVGTLLFSGLGTFNHLTIELWLILLGSAILLTVGDLLYMAGLEITPLSRAVPLSATYPIFSTGFAILLLSEDPSWLTIFGTFVVVVGVSLVVRKEITTSNDLVAPSERPYLGEIVIVLAAIAWGLAVILTGVVLQEPGVEVLPIVTIRLLFLLGMVFLLSIIQHREQLAIPTKEALLERGALVLGLGGILGFAIGMPGLFLSLELIGASQAVPLTSIYPMIAALLGVIFLKEKVGMEDAYYSYCKLNLEKLGKFILLLTSRSFKALAYWRRLESVDELGL